MKITGLLMGILLLIIPEIKSQVFLDWKELKETDELPSNNCYQVEKDNDGLLWIASQKGLARYDGYRFKTFNNNLPELAVYQIKKFKNGIFWLATNHGLQVFDPTESSYLSHDLDTFSVVSNITVIDDTKALFCTNSGIVLLNYGDDHLPVSESYIPYHTISSAFNDNIVHRIFHDDGKLLISFSGLGVYTGKIADLGKKEFEKMAFKTTGQGFLFDHCIAIRKISSTKLMFNFGYEGLYFFDNRTDLLTGFFDSTPGKKHLPNCWVSATKIEENSDYLYAFSTQHGLYRISLSDPELIESFSFSNLPGYNPTDNFVTRIQIIDDVLWLSTHGDGIKYARLNRSAETMFYPYASDYNKKLTVSGLIVDDMENIWLSTYLNGLTVMKKDSLSQRTTEEVSGLIRNFPDNKDLSALKYDSEGNLWSASAEGLGVLYREQLIQILKGQQVNMSFFRYDPQDVYSLNADNVFDILIDKDSIYVITDAGLNIYVPESNQFLNARNTEASPFHIPYPLYYLDKLGNKLILNGNNLSYIYSGGTISDNTSWFQEKIPFTINDITNHEDGFTYLATSSGLLRYDQLTDKISPEQTGSFLESVRINSMRDDQEGKLWMGTNQGLASYDLNSHLLTKHSVTQVSSSLYFHPGSNFKDENDLYFATNLGIVKITPQNDRQTNRYKSFSPVIISKRASEAEKRLIPLSKDSDTIHYPTIEFSNSKLIRFQMAVPASHFSDGIFFEYNIGDPEEEWIKVNKADPSIYFQNLHEGNYTLMVRASDANYNILSVSEIPFYKAPPWYRSVIAYIAYAFFLLLIILLLLKNKSQTLQKRHSKQLADQEKEKQLALSKTKLELITSVSHEFNAPLTIILNHISNMGNGTGTLQFESIRQNGDRLIRLARELNDIGKLENVHLMMRVGKTDFIQFLKNTTALFESYLTAKNLIFLFHSDYNELPLWFNTDEMEKVVCNLLSNAIKFTPEGGSIKLSVLQPESTSCEKSFVRLVIEDSGVGISARQLEKIYDFGYTTAPYNQTMMDSKGIGLSVTKKIIELHHWHIDFTSEPGKGTRCEILLKPGKSHFSAEQIKMGSDLQVSLKSPLKKEEFPEELLNSSVLVVDDDREITQFLENLLGNYFNITSAVNGLEGLRKAKEKVPDLIITDLAMPRKNGYYFIKKLKENHETKFIPVIVLTAHHSDDKKVQALNEGATAYITKPFDQKVLLATMKNILGTNHRLMKSYQEAEPELTGIVEQNKSELLKRAIHITKQHYADNDFDVQSLANLLKVSRSYLYQQFNETTTYSPKQFIQVMRVRKGASLLKSGKYRVNEVSVMVGYNSNKNFRKYFKDYFGVSPSEFLKTLN